ncbi:MAG: hypothetical protein ABI761_06775 [Saprospiraceae bacterium]
MNEYNETDNSVLTEYAKYLDDLVEKDQNIVFLNSSSKHASMVISRIFKHSNKEVLIRAKDLMSDIPKDIDYIIELMNFIIRGGFLRILLSEYKTDNPPEILKVLKLFSKKQVDIKLTNVNFILQESGEVVHFTVGTKNVSDTKPAMYRLEHDINNFLATGNFNDPNISSNLQSQFYQIFNSDKSTEVISF